MSHWNFRVIKTTKDDVDFFGLYETFYNEAGEICAHDEEPTIVGDDVEDIKKTLEMMRGDVDKHEVLDGYKIQFKDWDNTNNN